MKAIEKAQISKHVKQFFPAIASDLQLLEEIVEHGSLMTQPAGTTIMDYGDYVRMVPLLIKGSVKVMREGESGGEVLLYFLTAGETCTMSFSCCMQKKKSEIKTIVEDDVTMVGIPIRNVDLWISQYPSWKNFVMSSYDERMTEMVKTIDRIVFQKLDDRLLNYLQEKMKLAGKNTVEITHQQIGLDLNASREAISRLLKRMEKQGLLKLGRNKIFMLSEG